MLNAKGRTMNKYRYMKIAEWKAREFCGQGWDNKTIRRKIETGEITGIINGRSTLVREDQTLDMLALQQVDISDLVEMSH